MNNRQRRAMFARLKYQPHASVSYKPLPKAPESYSNKEKRDFYDKQGTNIELEIRKLDKQLKGKEYDTSREATQLKYARNEAYADLEKVNDQYFKYDKKRK